MDSSSTALQTGSPRTPERDGGFYIPDLGHSVLGAAWYEGLLTDPEPPAGAAAALEWLHPALLDARFAEQVRAAFHRNEPFRHAWLQEPLDPLRAAQIHEALAEADFVRHHYPLYEIDVARRERQAASALTGFVDWLASAAAAQVHAWLAGWPMPLRPAVQVQVARARAGDRFPMHHDADEEGLAAVYNFSRDWQPQYGGVLRCLDPRTGQPALSVEPRFNSMFLFRPANAPHEVTPIAAAAADWCRYTVTAFYLHPVQEPA
jgi:Rps23 Pro-64 3,4-dihydroxylase Tpa1-like proline 4-hydroxylase